MWIAAAAVQGQCAKTSVDQLSPSMFPLPTGVNYADCIPLHDLTPHYTKGINNKDLKSTFFYVSNAVEIRNTTASDMVDAVYIQEMKSLAKFKGCSGTYSGSVGGAFFITFVVLLYGAYRRRQLRLKFNIDGTWQDDVLAWLFCTQCAMCQEYRTMRGAHVEDGVWGGRSGWLLDSTTLKAPPSVAMV